MNDLTVVIVSYNTRDLLRNCLASLRHDDRDLCAEVFVVDNASSDASADMVEREFPRVKLIRNQNNEGFAAANNRALHRACSRYVLLLNSDTVVGPAALATMIELMDQHPEAGYCGPRLLNPDGSHQPSARRFPTVLSKAYSTLGLTRRYPHSRHTMDLHLSQGNCNQFRADWLCGACLLVRAECIANVGLLDEGFFLYFEETDWCHRMASFGWEGWYLGDAEVVHLGSQSVVHDGGVKPFSGDHPVYWARSSRRYMRRYHGIAGQIVSEGLQIVLYSLIWMRHCWRRAEPSRRKSREAAAAIRHLVT